MGVGGPELRLQVKIQAFEEKMVEEGAEGANPGSQARFSLGQAAREEHREMRFNRLAQRSPHLFFASSLIPLKDP